MSETKIPDKVKLELWIKAGGRCQYEGCNIELWHDDLTLAKMNRSYIAHIIADKANGPRGDVKLSPLRAKEIGNLMLMCDGHHRLIDKIQVAEHPPERLSLMKVEHERRIAILGRIKPEKKTEVLLYGARVGEQHIHINWDRATQAIVPERYPLSLDGIGLSIRNSSFGDHESEYWSMEAENLRRQYKEQLKPRLAEGRIPHLSVFALAPQPLLMLLGSLLTDISVVDVFQLHREPKQDWCWQPHPDNFQYIVLPPQPQSDGPPALVFALSADIALERIHKVLGPAASIWQITIPEPDRDFLKSREQLQQFRELMRNVMNQIKQNHGKAECLHVFPAMPVATAVEFGRILMPKADLPLLIYDENSVRGGFTPALSINPPVRV